jgi:hypothetical protein
MPKARVVKSGWSWLGEPMVVGQIIDAPSPQWIANRIADNGLVEAIDDVDVVAPPVASAVPATVEITTAPAAEIATTPAPRASAKKKGT